ncbi:hypothetical protein HYV80_05530 [Candidatus Woesearchaeota archaeon]|nr:hypothetical protein [Candidatus Woesearchaeota archaeon]
MKKILALIAALLALAAVAYAAGGFDQYGYNRKARIFNGPASGWCLQRGAPADCMGAYSNDRLVMKWNAEWDRGNAEGWTDSNGYNAWLDNEWNGAFPGGSGAVWHYKIKWSSVCANGGTPTDGGYCIWGQFETLMDQGKDPSYGLGHIWFAKAVPNGYGTN